MKKSTLLLLILMILMAFFILYLFYDVLNTALTGDLYS